MSQFLDLGAGIPTVGNTHEVAARLNPQAHTVYVDNDLVAVAHSRSLLTDVPNTTVVHADLRDTQTVLEQARGLLDFTQPVAVLMFAVLHFVPDQDDPAARSSTPTAPQPRPIPYSRSPTPPTTSKPSAYATWKMSTATPPSA